MQIQTTNSNSTSNTIFKLTTLAQSGHADVLVKLIYVAARLSS